MRLEWGKSSKYLKIEERKKIAHAILLAGAFFVVLAEFALTGFMLSAGLFRAQAINVVENGWFNRNSTGWTSIRTGAGLNACGLWTQTTVTAMATSQFSATTGTPAGAWSNITSATKNTAYKAYFKRTVQTPTSTAARVTARIKLKVAAFGPSIGNDAFIRADLLSADETTAYFSACSAITGRINWVALESSGYYIANNLNMMLRVTAYSKTNSTAAANYITVDNVSVDLSPYNLLATSTNPDTKASLSWDNVAQGAGDPILSPTSSFFAYATTTYTWPSLVTDFVGTSTAQSFLTAALRGNTTYYFDVSNMDASGTMSDTSPTTTFLTRPDAPQSPSFSSVGGSTLRFEWAAPLGGAGHYNVYRCQNSGCTNYALVGERLTTLYFDDSGLTGGSTYMYVVRAGNNTGFGASSTPAEVTMSSGSLGADIVDGAGASVSSPSMSMSPASVSFAWQSIAGTFGTETQKLRVNNPTAGAIWTLSIAASLGDVGLWDGASSDYDYNDSGPTDTGVDADSLGGRLQINPQLLTITPQGGCASTGLTKGNADWFLQGTTSSITILKASA
ncbi:MAG: fibronectin type III domain-containing protein [Alphaproteobacteria bacterium]|nr:fibronectin type III domain-containing protein [Alphaproteobacteria bacterium]